MQISNKIFKLILIDQFTKFLISLITGIVFLKDIIELQFWGNTRISSVNIWFLLFLIVALIYLIYHFRNNGELTLSLVYVFSGAVSNFLDYIFRGFIVDWIHIFGIVFNFADIFIFLGVVLILKSLLKSSKNDQNSN